MSRLEGLKLPTTDGGVATLGVVSFEIQFSLAIGLAHVFEVEPTTVAFLAIHDASDGLGQDASHLASTNTQLVIDAAMIPLREGATIPKAFSDGEDYELLFTSTMKPPEDIATAIGFVQRRTNEEPKVVTTKGEDISMFGWMHE